MDTDFGLKRLSTDAVYGIRSSNSQNPQSKNVNSARRWIRRIIYPLFIVIFVALAAIQIVIWSDWPRRVVLSLVQQQLGLRVEATGLTTSWLGTTTLRDVKLSLPLSGESFLDMPTMTVRHTGILRLIITRNFDLHEIELNKPNLVVRRDSAGHWNLQDVAQLIARATAGTPDPGTKSSPPKLPTFRLNDGSIVVIDEKTGQRIKIAPVTASGDPQGALVWQYSLNVPKKLEITGLVAPGEDFKHEFKFSAVPGEWLTPWIAQPPAPLRINGSWTGALVNKKTLVGRLVLDDAQIANFGAKGRIGIQANDDDATFTPQNLTVTTSMDTVPQVLIASGTLQLHGETLTAQQLRFGELGKLAQLDGSADLAGKTADFNGVWQEIALPGHVTHSGHLHFSVKNSFPSHPIVTGDIATTGKTEQGTWEGNVHLDGNGRNWQEMDWTASIPHLGWSAKLQFGIDELTAHFTQRGQLITLTDLKWPAADHITGRGDYNLRDQTWALRIRGGGTLQKIASSNGPTPLDFNLDALGSFGDVKRVHLNDVFVHTRGIEAHAAGDYVSNVANDPVSLSVYVTHRPSDLANEEDLPIRGKFRSEGHVGGTLDPIHLNIKGVVHSEDLVIRGHPYGDIHGTVTGIVESDHETFVVGDMTMLGGSWKVSTVWPYDQKDKLTESEALRIQVGVQHLSLPEVGDLLKVTGLQGESNGEWTIDITKPKLNLLEMRGSLDAKDVSFRDVHADTMTAQMKLHNGTLQIDPIELHRAEKGVTIASFETTLDDLTAPTLDVKTTAWPIHLSSKSAATTALWLDTKLQLDTKTSSATGPIKARAMFATTQQAIGEATIDGNMNGRLAVLDSIKFTGVDGLAQGRATIDTALPNRSTVVLSWSGLEGQHLADLIPQLQGLEGKFDGALTLDPSDSNRAIEPLRLRLQLNPENAKYKAIAIGPAKLSAFMNFNSSFAPSTNRAGRTAGRGRRSSGKREQELDARTLHSRSARWRGTMSASPTAA